MSSPRLFAVAIEEEDVEESRSKIDSSKNSGGMEKDARDNNLIKGGEENGYGIDDEAYVCSYETSVSSTESEKPFLGQFDAGDEDEGFRTPTDLEHRIPVITECPPAPKKSSNWSTKRKEMSPRIRRSLLLDFSFSEIQSIFRPTRQEDDTKREIKRVRQEDSE